MLSFGHQFPKERGKGLPLPLTLERVESFNSMKQFNIKFKLEINLN